MSDAYNKAVQLNRSELFIGFEWLWACYSHLFHGKFLKIPNAMMCTSTPRHHLLQWNYTRTDTWEPNFHTTHVQTRESLMLLHEGLTQLLSTISSESDTGTFPVQSGLWSSRGHRSSSTRDEHRHCGTSHKRCPAGPFSSLDRCYMTYTICWILLECRLQEGAQLKKNKHSLLSKQTHRYLVFWTVHRTHKNGPSPTTHMWSLIIWNKKLSLAV